MDITVFDVRIALLIVGVITAVIGFGGSFYYDIVDKKALWPDIVIGVALFCAMTFIMITGPGA